MQNLWSAQLKSYCDHIWQKNRLHEYRFWEFVPQIAIEEYLFFSSNAHQMMVFEYLSILESTHFTNKLQVTIPYI